MLVAWGILLSQIMKAVSPSVGVMGPNGSGISWRWEAAVVEMVGWARSTEGRVTKMCRLLCLESNRGSRGGQEE